MASNPKIGEKIGESNAQEFKEQITKLQETFDKTPRNRDSVIQDGLSTLTQWCDIKQEKTQKGIWANIKSTVTAAVSTLGAIVSKDAEMYKQSILKLKQKASELTGHGKEFSKELENIKKIAKDYGISNLEGSLLKKILIHL